MIHQLLDEKHWSNFSEKLDALFKDRDLARVPMGVKGRFLIDFIAYPNEIQLDAKKFNKKDLENEVLENFDFYFNHSVTSVLERSRKIKNFLTKDANKKDLNEIQIKIEQKINRENDLAVILEIKQRLTYNFRFTPDHLLKVYDDILKMN